MTESSDKLELPPEPNPQGPEDAQPFVMTLPDDPASGADWYLWAAVMALLIVVSYCPGLSGNFIWDDDRYVTQNRALQDLPGLVQIWKYPPGTVQFYPLTFTALWVQHHFWGAEPLGYRVVNLLLHAGAAIILWRILRRLSVPGAWVAATLWAVHPLQTETVSWVSEIKNTLSGILVLTSVLFYLDWLEIREQDSPARLWRLPEQWQTYAISLAFFVLALLSKSVVATIPLALLLTLWWKRKLSPKSVLGLVPMLTLGAIAGKLTSWMTVTELGASAKEWNLDFGKRLLIAGRSLWVYVAKLILPIHQSFNYSRIVPGSSGWIFLLAAAAVVVVLALLATSTRIGRGPLVAFLCYGAILFPSLGFVDVYPFRFSFVADHFQYLAGIPLIVLAVAISARVLSAGTTPELTPEGKKPATASVSVVLAAALLVLMGAVSWVRAGLFTSQANLWEDVLQPGKNPNSWLAASNLARIRQGEASSAFDDAARLIQAGDQDSSKASATQAADDLGKSDALIQQVLDNPDTPGDVRYRAYNQLAQNEITRTRGLNADVVALMDRAEADLNKSISLAAQNEQYALDPLPDYTMGMVKLNQARQLQRKLAKPQRIGPDIPATANATTRPASPAQQQIIDAYLAAQSAYKNAAEKSLKSLSSPTLFVEAKRVLPLAAFERGNVDWELASIAQSLFDINGENQYDRAAINDYALAARVNPSKVESHYQLALSLENVGDLNDARNELILILRDLNHNYAPAYNEIGRVILASRPTDMAEYQAAIESFKAALQIDPNMASARRNLALAEKMLASTRPTSRPTSLPSSPPAPATNAPASQ